MLAGKGCLDYLESICTADVKALKENASVLTVFTAENGGILDDLIITKITDDHLFVVSNAGRKEHDQQHMLNSLVTSITSQWNANKLTNFSRIRTGKAIPGTA